MTTKLPAPIPAAITRVPRARTTRTRTESFKAWKSAIEDANQAVGYDKTSSIWGMSDIDVLQQVYAALTATKPHNAMAPAIQELIKRKTAKALASQTYRAKP